MQLYDFNPDDAYRFAREGGFEAYKHDDELLFKYCPYCNGGKNHDKNTFAINLKTGAWNCKRGSCERKGNMITLMQDFDWFSLGDGIDDYYLRRERFAKFAKRPIESKDKAIEYMKSRGIPEKVTRDYSITIHKDQANVMVFPFYDERGDMWFVKYRNLKPKKGSSKEWCEPNRKPILFGMDHCNFENKTLVMTEGQIDSLSCVTAGIENAISVPTGKNGFTWVPYCFNFLGRFDELIVFGDYENGEISLLDGMKTRFHGKVKFVRPEDYKDCKDANEILLKYGAEQIKRCVENAECVPVPGLKRIVDIQRISLRDLDRMETGIAQLDKACPFFFGELIILTGAAGEGKSTLASQWATKALDQGYPTAIYSGEMPDWLVKNWIDFQIAGTHNLNHNNDIESDTYQKMLDWDMYKNNLYVYDVDNAEDGDETLFKVLIDGIQQYGIRFIVVDNLMTAMDYNSNLELNEAQTKFTKRLANIAQAHNVIIVLIVHPRKSKGLVFSNSDIAGSSNITNRAHKVVRYSRPDKEFTDIYGKKWKKDTLPDCPIRFLTVLKDRMTGHTINKGIPLYYEERTKRIAEDPSGFNWELKWEGEFEPVDDMEDIPF